MRIVASGCLLRSIAAGLSEARPFSAGVSFAAKLQSDVTGATATMAWTTRNTCALGPLVFQGRPEFRCAGKWSCDGEACPGRRGRLEFTFDPGGFHDVLLRVSPQIICTAHFVGIVQEPQIPPYHWSYQCLKLHPSTGIDSGAAVVDLQAPE